MVTQESLVVPIRALSWLDLGPIRLVGVHFSYFCDMTGGEAV